MLKNKATKWFERFQQFPIPLADNRNSINLSIDLKSCDLYPDDGCQDNLPRKTTGDENCLYNAASSVTWANEEHSTALRVRTNKIR